MKVIYFNYENEFVPYELAVKLKKLGYDEECFGAWRWYFNGAKSYQRIDLSNEYCIKNSLCNEKSKYSLLSHLSISAPLWQQAFDWLNSNFGLFASFDKIDNSRKFYYNFTIVNSIVREYDDSILIDSAFREVDWAEYKTYEEARLACLTKLIEIVENDTNRK